MSDLRTSSQKPLPASSFNETALYRETRQRIKGLDTDSLHIALNQAAALHVEVALAYYDEINNRRGVK